MPVAAGVAVFAGLILTAIGSCAAEEDVANEGSWVVEHAGRFHLMYSGNFANTADYAVGVAVSDDPQGPFERYLSNPILATDLDHDLFGPGHHSIAPGLASDLLIFFHAKVELSPGWDRRVRYAGIAFDGDGRLRVSPP